MNQLNGQLTIHDEVKTEQSQLTVISTIDKIFTYNTLSIRVIGTADDPWFSGKDIATQLGYKKPEKAICDHITDESFRAKLGDLVERFKPSKMEGLENEGISMKGNAKNSIYINEAGVYAMAFGSTLPAAIAFKNWVLKDVLPSIRKTGSYQLNAQLQSLKGELRTQQLLTDQNAKIAEEQKTRADNAESNLVLTNAQLNRLYTQNSNFICGKKFGEPQESIYIIASHRYASVGIYKIGRTKEIVSRLKNHNTSRVVGDHHVVLEEFKVNDAALVEYYIHSKLKHIIVKGETEFFKAPFRKLADFVKLCVDFDNGNNISANSLVDARYTLECQEFKAEDWMDGIPPETFGPAYYQPTGAILEKITISDLSEDKKHEIVQSAITSWLKTEKNIDYALPMDAARIIEPKIQIKWCDLSGVIKTRLQHGEGMKFTKQQAEWSSLFETLLKDAVSIEFKPYRSSKIKSFAMTH